MKLKRLALSILPETTEIVHAVMGAQSTEVRGNKRVMRRVSLAVPYKAVPGGSRRRNNRRGE